MWYGIGSAVSLNNLLLGVHWSGNGVNSATVRSWPKLVAALTMWLLVDDAVW
jgi:hypothetical protein